MIRYCGLDVHRKETRACVQDESGEILHEETLPTTREALSAFAIKHLGPEARVALEATFHSWAIADVLRPHVAHVLVSNPLQTKAIAQAKIKTDKIDARVLCHLLRCDYLPAVWAPDEATRQLRTLTRWRATLVSELVRIKNRIHGALAHELVPLAVNDLFTDKGMAWLSQVELGPLTRQRITSDLALLEATETQMQALDGQLARNAYDDPRVKLFMTLVGVDYAAALTVIAALGDTTRFRDGDHAASYLGLVPSTHQSGEHTYHGPITKRGACKARWMLIQAAQHAATHPGPLGVFFRRLAKRKNRKVAVVATARKMVAIAWRMLQENQPYRYAQPLPTQNKLAKLRVKATGKRRKSGNPKGTPQPAHRGSGQRFRTTPALTEVYEQEGLPPVTEPKPAEKRMLQQAGAAEFAASIQAPQRKARTASPPVNAQRSSSAVHDPTEPAPLPVIPSTASDELGESRHHRQELSGWWISASTGIARRMMADGITAKTD